MVEAGGFDEPATERAVNLLLDNYPGRHAHRHPANQQAIT
jgi:hypothetical protein